MRPALSARRFRAARALGTSFALCWRHRWVLLLVTAVAFAPYALLRSYVHADLDPGAWGWIARSIQLLAEGLLTAVVASALTAPLLAGSRHGVPPPRVALTRLPASLPLVILQAAVVLLSALAADYAFRWAWMEFGSTMGYATLLLVGLVSIGPQVVWYVAVPVAVVERRGFLGSLRRSALLVRGRRLAIAAIWSFAILLTFALVLLTSALGFNLKEVSLAGAAAHTALLALVAALDAVIRNVVHRDLRREHEGVDPDEVAAVFD
jgi:hypothetical protein